MKQICCYGNKKEGSSSNTRRFNSKKSIKRARARKTRSPKWGIKVTEGEYVWATKMERVSIIRKGLPYESMEVLSKRADLPVKQVLHLFGVPQTTYNKKKKDKDLLSRRDTEVILVLTELLGCV